MNPQQDTIIWAIVTITVALIQAGAIVLSPKKEVGTASESLNIGFFTFIFGICGGWAIGAIIFKLWASAGGIMNGFVARAAWGSVGGLGVAMMLNYLVTNQFRRPQIFSLVFVWILAMTIEYVCLLVVPSARPVSGYSTFDNIAMGGLLFCVPIAGILSYFITVETFNGSARLGTFIVLGITLCVVHFIGLLAYYSTLKELTNRGIDSLPLPEIVCGLLIGVAFVAIVTAAGMDSPE